MIDVQTALTIAGSVITIFLIPVPFLIMLAIIIKMLIYK